MDTPTDRRATRTKKALKHAMLELLRKKDISKITVSELTEHADIGRGTFYLHFTDLYDLLDKLENETLEQAVSAGKLDASRWSRENLLIHLAHVWTYIYQNIDTFRVLTDRRNGTRFMDKFRRYAEKEAHAATGSGTYQNHADAYTVTYIISGTMGIFQRWMEEGAPIPPDELAKITRNIIQGE